MKLVYVVYGTYSEYSVWNEAEPKCDILGVFENLADANQECNTFVFKNAPILSLKLRPCQAFGHNIFFVGLFGLGSV